MKDVFMGQGTKEKKYQVFVSSTYEDLKEERAAVSRSVQIAILMATGCAIMLTIAFLVGWIPTDEGLLPALLAVVSMLLTAFVISVFSYRRQKKLAERINRELELRRQ